MTYGGKAVNQQNSKCKGPEVRSCLVCSWNRKRPVTGLRFKKKGRERKQIASKVRRRITWSLEGPCLSHRAYSGWRRKSHAFTEQLVGGGCSGLGALIIMTLPKWPVALMGGWHVSAHLRVARWPHVLRCSWPLSTALRSVIKRHRLLSVGTYVQ